MCFLSPLVEVGTFAFLAAELDDAAESAIGSVADQPKTTVTVGAPLHAILPFLQFFNPPERRANAVSRSTFAWCSHIRVSGVIRIPGTADYADHNADLENGQSIVWPDVAVGSCPHGRFLTFARVE
jgi:hypothetical protein